MENYFVYKDIEELVFDYAKKGIRLWIEGDKLKYLLNNNSNYSSEKILNTLSRNKESIINFLKKENCFDTAYPTSYEQRSLWFLDTMYDTGSAYNLFTVIEINDDINIKKLQNSILTIVLRHDILKTHYFMQFGNLWQKTISNDIFEKMITTIDYIDAIDDKLFEECLEEIAKQKFDLKLGPVINCKIIKRIKGNLYKYYCLFCVHHIAADFNSLQILQHEITEHYYEKELISNKNNYFKTINVCEDEGKYFNSLHLQLENLRQLPDIPDLGWKHTLSNSNSFINISWELDLKLSNDLRIISEKLGVTVFSVIFSIYAISIAKLSNSSNLLINLATTITDRNNNFIVGNFSNLVPIIVNINSNRSYKEIIVEVFNTILKSEEYRNLPFSLLVDKMGLSNVDMKSPLTPLTFAWHSGQTKNTPKIGNTYNNSRQIGSSGDLMLTARDIDGLIDFKLCSNSNKSTSLMLISLKNKILECINEISFNNEVKISETITNHSPIVLNKKPKRNDIDFFKRLEFFSKKNNLKVAVKAQNDELNYADLISKSKTIANILKSEGINVGDRVIVNVDKNIYLVPFILGIMLLGATYVPLDVSLPIERIKIICEDCKPKLIISDNKNLKFINIPQKDMEFFNLNQLTKFNITKTDNLISYIIYTSGSTGIPKGVPITYESLNVFLNSISKKILFNTETIFLSISSISFDASIAEIFMPLFSGGTLVLTSSNDSKNPEKIDQLINENNINSMQATPTTWSSLLTRYPAKIWDLDAFSMGEALPTILAKQLVNHVKSLWNLYGPTESTVYVTVDKFDPLNEIQISSNNIPIKDILDSSNLFILDKDNYSISSIGSVGELCITGNQLSSGYINSNNDSFLNLPLGPDGEYIPVYKTGDLARYNLDCYIDIIGRLDNQIKIKGYRIELGEIESVIKSFPNVDNCSVISTYERNIEIIAVVVGCNIDINSLNEYLSSKLPKYMIPNGIHIIESLPVNNSGKVDKKSILHFIKSQAYKQTREPVTDNSALEEKLLNIISKILDRVIDDKSANLFSIGINSLQSVRLKMEILNLISVDLTMDEIYNYPSVNGLAYLVESKMKNLSLNNKTTFKNDILLQDFKIPENKSNEIKYVLLTGASGYLGSSILKKLIENENVIIYCLVRSKNDKDAKSKVLKALGNGYDESKLRNVHIISGFLGTPYFGMEHNDYIALSELIDSVIHCAALVNFTLPYSVMRENVVSTKQIIEFCCESKLKYLNFISTYSVLNPELSVLPEKFYSEKHEFINFGYAESKWVCEQLLSKAKLLGIPCKIYRPSRIISDINSENLNFNDFYSVMLAGVVFSGYAPLETGYDNFVDVNKIASVIVEESIRYDHKMSIIHLCGKRWTSWESIINLLEISTDQKFQKISYDDWIEIVYQLANKTPSLYSLQEIYPFLSGAANNLRKVFAKTYPKIEVNSNLDLDVDFSEKLISYHYNQIKKFHTLVE